jgi:hypothetical protein
MNLACAEEPPSARQFTAVGVGGFIFAVKDVCSTAGRFKTSAKLGGCSFWKYLGLYGVMGENGRRGRKLYAILKQNEGIRRGTRMRNGVVRALPPSFNNCSDISCNGVMELVARSENIRHLGIKKVNRLQELPLMRSGSALLLVYKCSRCQKIDFRANNKLSEVLDDRSVFFQTNQSVI